jgi:hypothetical protein
MQSRKLTQLIVFFVVEPRMTRQLNAVCLGNLNPQLGRHRNLQGLVRGIEKLVVQLPHQVRHAETTASRLAEEVEELFDWPPVPRIPVDRQVVFADTDAIEASHSAISSGKISASINLSTINEAVGPHSAASSNSA